MSASAASNRTIQPFPTIQCVFKDFTKEKTKDVFKIVRDALRVSAELFARMGKSCAALTSLGGLFADGASMCDIRSWGSSFNGVVEGFSGSKDRVWNVLKEGQLVVAYAGRVSKLFMSRIASVARFAPWGGFVNSLFSIAPCAMTIYTDSEAIHALDKGAKFKGSKIEFAGALNMTKQEAADARKVYTQYHSDKRTQKIFNIAYQVAIIALCVLGAISFLSTFPIFSVLSVAVIPSQAFLALSVTAVTAAVTQFTYGERAKHHEKNFGCLTHLKGVEDLKISDGRVAKDKLQYTPKAKVS